jgi:ABC-type branched-subunit amino acid transport system substrate-binding protein
MRVVRFAFALAIGLTAVATAMTPDDGVTATTVTFGLEGVTRSFSADEENLGFRLAFDEANAGGGVHGRTIRTKAYDRPADGGDAPVVANATRLIDQDRVFGLVNWGGPPAIPVLALTAERKVPYLFPHSALVSSESQRYLFTSFPRYESEAAMMFPYLARQRGLKRLGLVHDVNAYGRLFLERLTALAPSSGYTVVGTVPVAESTPADLSDGMRRLKDAGADAIVLALYPAQARAVVAAKRAVDWRGRLVTVGPLTDEQYLQTPDGVAEGALGFCYYPDPEESQLPGVIRYRRAMSLAQADHPVNRYSLYGYTFGRIVVEGLRRAGRDLTRDRLVDALETVTEWDSGGVLPPVSFSRTNHHAQRAGFVCELERGRFRAKSEWITP